MPVNVKRDAWLAVPKPPADGEDINPGSYQRARVSVPKRVERHFRQAVLGKKCRPVAVYVYRPDMLAIEIAKYQHWLAQAHGQVKLGLALPVLAQHGDGGAAVHRFSSLAASPGAHHFASDPESIELNDNGMGSLRVRKRTHGQKSWNRGYDANSPDKLRGLSGLA
jgi:hypothetical protein